MSDNHTYTINLLGAGNMGSAMLFGWLDNGITAERINVIDPAPPQAIAGQFAKAGIHHVATPGDAEIADLLVVAVKPQIMDQVLDGAVNLVGAMTVVVSVAAGRTISFIEQHLGKVAIVRAMPNTPAQIRRGITVAVANSRVDPVGRKRADTLLGATGPVEWVDDERLMDAVTAVSGSGPAYVFHLIECLATAGIEAGLDEALATRLATETVAGAGALAQQATIDAATLRENVTSPGGTTQAALSILMDKDGLGLLMSRAVAAAAKRSRELA